jgi:hypothetical protein
MATLSDLRREIKIERDIIKRREEEKKLKSELKKLKFDKKYGAVVSSIKTGYKKIDQAVGKLKAEQEKGNQEVKKGLGLFR